MALDLSETSESPRLQEQICLFAKDYPFEKASDMLRRTLSIEVSASKIRETAEQKGSEIQGHIESEVANYSEDDFAPEQDTSSAETMYLEIDGSMVPMKKDWKEAKLVVSFEQKDRATTGNKDRPVLLNKNYTGKVSGVDEFKKYFRYHVKNYGVSKAKNLVVLADGAEWIWGLAEENLSPARTEILDYYHASEYAWEFAKAISETEEDTKQIGATIETLLLEKSPEDAIEYIENIALSEQRNGAIDAKKKILRYYGNHCSRMNYKSYREQGFIIGSGAIESGNKNIIQSRCKQTGMHWSIEGVNSIIALRCHYECQKWDDIKWGGYAKAA